MRGIMEPFARAYYELRFQVSFMERGQTDFQGFFSEVMEKRYPSDFQRVRPWGNVGDQKNDGYLKSLRMLFQVYAPNEMAASKAILKVHEDFHGALPYWEKYFDNWVFVHNSMQGLGPDVLAKLLELGGYNPSISVTHWGYEELRQQTFGMTEADIASLLGPVPSTRDIVDLRFESLRDVLLVIAGQEPLDELDIRPVPADKLSQNSLSANTRILLKAGMHKADLVGQFFENWPLDPGLGDKVAETFRKTYETLRDARVMPDAIFERLYEFAGGRHLSSPSHQVAVLAVLAYFFEQCDIFEATQPE